MAFDVTSIREGDFNIISLKGQIDISSHEHLLKALYETLKIKSQGVILDLSGVSFISSNGIGAIMEAKAFVEKNNGRFILSGSNSKISNIFNLIGLMNELEYYNTSEEALKKLLSVSVS